MPPAYILAAGFSRRLGRPKQELIYETETLLARTIRIATEAGLYPILTITQHSPSPTNLLNETPEEGIASSIRLAITQARQIEATGAVLLTCDQPALTPAHLQQLCEHPAEPTGSAYANRIGIPAYFPSSSFPSLLELRGDTGARDLLRHARAIPCEALALDIDTPADLEILSTPQTPPATTKPS